MTPLKPKEKKNHRTRLRKICAVLIGADIKVVDRTPSGRLATYNPTLYDLERIGRAILKKLGLKNK